MMPDRLSDLRHSFDRWAETYEEDARQGVGVLEGHARSLATAAGLIQVPPAQAVLDIGVGTGAFGALFEAQGAEITGVDLSPRMLELAAARHPGWRLLEGDFLALPLPDASVDVAVSAFAFHHLETAERPAALAEIFRVVRGGTFLLVDIMFADEAGKDSARRRLAGHWDEENYPVFADLAQSVARVGLNAALTRLSDLHGAAVIFR